MHAAACRIRTDATFPPIKYLTDLQPSHQSLSEPGNFSFRKILPPPARPNFTPATRTERRSAQVRSQPPPPPLMLRNGGSGGGCSLRCPQFHNRPLARAQPRRTSTSARPPQSPPPPMLAQRGFRGPAACVCASSTSPPLRAIGYASRNPTASGLPTRSRFAPSNTP